VTNGILIGEKKVSFMVEYNINVIVSIHEGSFHPLKSKIEILRKLGDNIGLYIIFDPKNFNITLRNFLFFANNGFRSFNFAPEIYANWNDENLEKLRKILWILLPFVKKNHMSISGISPYKLKVLNRGCEKTVYDEK